MRKGRLVSLRALPQITLLDDNGKLKVVELEALILERVDAFAGELAAYHTLKVLVNQPVEYVPSKRSQHRCKLLNANGQDIGYELVAAGLATIDEEELKNTTLYSSEEAAKLIAAQDQARNLVVPVFSNCVKENELLADLFGLLGSSEGSFNIEGIKDQLVVSQGTVYFAVTPTHLNLSTSNIDEEAREDFLKLHRTLPLKITRPVFVLERNSYVVKAQLPLEVEKQLLRRGWADLSVEAEIQLDGDTYEILNSARQQAVKGFLGIWSNPTDIFQLAYTKDNFLGVPVQIDEGNVFLVKNVETGQYQSVEVSGVICPQKEQVGAYEAREFSRKEALGREFNVFVKKDLGFRQVVVLVRVSDGQRYNKLLVSNGWATVRQEKETAVDPQSSRLLELQKKCSGEKSGLFSPKIGKIRFQDLTKNPTQELREHLKALYDRLTNSLHHNRQLISAVVVAYKKNNVLSLLLKQYRFIVNVELEGTSVLDFKLVLKEYTDFKEDSATFLRDNILQRDVELEVVDLREPSCQLVGYVYLGGRDVAEALLETGLVCCSEGFAEIFKRKYAELEEKAKRQHRGMWTPLLSRLKSSKESSPPERPFRAIVSEVVDGSTIYYQTNENLERLDREIAPVLERGIDAKLHKQHIKVGNLCAAPFEDGKLYRARILSQRKKGNKVWLIYVDYGNRMLVDQSELRELPEQLMKIEELAQKSRLFLIKKLNVNQENKAACIEEIQQVILNKEYTMVPVTEESVVLYDSKDLEATTEDIGKSTNVELISQGIAKPLAEDLQMLTPEQQNLVRDLASLARATKTQPPSVWLEHSEDEEVKRELGDL